MIVTADTSRHQGHLGSGLTSPLSCEPEFLAPAAAIPSRRSVGSLIREGLHFDPFE